MAANACSNFCTALNRCPDAIAQVRGSREYPAIRGAVRFYQTAAGVLVSAEISGLPHEPGACTGQVFGFHIHSGDSCTGTPEVPFANARGHYNPAACAHPHHAGDMPPLFGNQGRAFLAFLTDRFTLEEIIGRVVIVHAAPDDFTTQPSGNAGVMIACGEIRRTAH